MPTLGIRLDFPDHEAENALKEKIKGLDGYLPIPKSSAFFSAKTVR
jgi:hypothetical protein